jgi:hypothetical protein
VPCLCTYVHCLLTVQLPSLCLQYYRLLDALADVHADKVRFSHVCMVAHYAIARPSQAKKSGEGQGERDLRLFFSLISASFLYFGALSRPLTVVQMYSCPPVLVSQLVASIELALTAHGPAISKMALGVLSALAHEHHRAVRLLPHQHSSV